MQHGAAMLETDGTQALARLAGIPDAAREEIDALRAFLHLRVLVGGEALVRAGEAADAMTILVTGRLVETGGAREHGRGGWIGTRGCLTGEPARETIRAIRESVVLQLGREHLASAAQASPAFARVLLARCANEAAEPPYPPPARLLLASADDAPLDDIVSAILPAFEQLGNVRLIRPGSFGAGQPGGISLGAWETRHELQEQEQSFDLTVTILDASDEARAKTDIEEADEILFVAQRVGGPSAPNPWLSHALTHRGGQACRALLLPEAEPSRPAFEAIRSIHVMRKPSDTPLALLARLILGRGVMLVCASTGVHAAAVWGAMRAFRMAGGHALAAGAAGSAILPVALHAAGASDPEVERVFAGLADVSAIFKRAQRPASGLYEARPLDEFLVHTLPATDISEFDMPFAGATANLSASGAAHLHRKGKLRALVRGSLLPAGLLPPVITEEGDIVVSGAHHMSAVIGGLRRIGASEILLIETESAPLGRAEITYRDLTAGPGFGLRGLGLGARQDRRLVLETQLAELSAHPAAARDPATRLIRWRIPMPSGVSPLDWPAWRALRDLGDDFAKARLAGIKSHLTPSPAGTHTSEAG